MTQNIFDKLLVKTFASREQLGVNAAHEAGERIKELLSTKNEINIIFAAAPSQNEFLNNLEKQEGIEWTKINAFHMDEYVGLAKDAPQGFGNFLRKALFDRVPFKSKNFLDGNAENIYVECKRYADVLKRFTPDIVCMGIGENTHIAFNDPHVANFNDRDLVKIVELDESCRQQQVNDGCFTNIDQVPFYAITLTIPVLMSTPYIFCMVPSKRKAEAVKHTLHREINESHPSTILRLHHNAILYIDNDSAAALQ